MKLLINKYFEEAKKRNIEPYQITYSTSTETSVEVHNGEVEVQEIGSSQDIGAKGIVNGKQGLFATDCIDSKTPELLAENVLNSSIYGKEAKADNYFKGGLKYKKAKTKLKDFKSATLKELREFAFEVYNEIKKQDSRLTSISVSVTKQEELSQKFNSYGVKCKDEGACYFCSVSIVAEDENKEPRSGGKSSISFLSLDDLRQDIYKKIPEIISSAVDFFGSKPLDTKKYKVLLDRTCVASLLSCLLSQLNAKSVQKHLSLFEGKIDSQIISKNITITNEPHCTSASSSSYDADGYPTKEFTLIKNGVLKDYLYSVETANIDNRESNGCSIGDGNARLIRPFVKPGKNDFDTLFKKVNNGLYITSISGLNSGIDGQTLDFSLPCEGYLIKDGKKDKAFSMMIVAGNLLDVFNNVLAIGNESSLKEMKFYPSMIIKSLTVSGK